MKITLFEDPLDTGWQDRAVGELRDWYVREWPKWFNHQLGDQSAEHRAKIVFHCLHDWVHVASVGLQYVDGLLRREGVEITINITDLRLGARSKMSIADRKGTITIPLTYFPKVYAAAVCACEAEYELQRGSHHFMEMHKDQSDPFETPFGWITQDLDTPGEVKHWQPSLVMGVNALVIITLHELAHCLLGHRNSGLTSVEMRAQEAEADTLAGVLYAALDPRIDQARARGEPFWNEEYAWHFARSATLVAAFTRSNDFKQQHATDADRQHHRATTRYRHLAFGALRRLHILDPTAAEIAHAALETAPARLEMWTFASALEKYAEEEPESETDWKSYETQTAPLGPQLSAKLRDRRLPVLARLLEPMGLRMDPGVD